MKLTKPVWALVVLACALPRPAIAASTGPWEQPASDLANQIAATLGSGQARLTVINLSTIPDGEIPAIRDLLTEDLKTHGIAAGGDESANSVRITLSQSASRRLWVAEILEGNQTEVAMVDAGPAGPPAAPSAPGVTLLRQEVFAAREPLLAMLETPS